MPWTINYIFVLIGTFLLIRLALGLSTALTGFVDDILELKPLPKMLGIVIGAVIVWAFTDFRFYSFKIPFGGPMIHFGPVLTLILTVFGLRPSPMPLSD